MLWVPRANPGVGVGSGCARGAPGLRRRRVVASAVLAMLASASADAADVHWIAPANGSWGDPQNWDITPPGIPGPGDDVTIDVPGNIVVTVKQDIQTIHSLVSNEGLTVESGGLVLAADSTVNGAFTLNGIGTLGGAGNLTLTGASTWSDATTMEGSGKTIVSPGGTLAIVPGTYIKTLKRTIENSGAVTFTADNIFASIDLHDALIDNKAGATFTVTGSAGSFFYGGVGANTFANAGTFNKLGTGTSTFGGGGSLPVLFVNSGTVDVNAGALVLQTGATHTGHFQVANGGRLQFEGGHHLTSTADITGGGTVVFNSAGVNVVDGPVNVSGVVQIEGATSTFNNTFSANNFYTPNGATITFNGTTTLGGSFLMNTILDGAGNVTFTADSNWSGYGSMSGSGRTTIAAGTTFGINAGAAPKELRRLLVNDGTVNWNGTGALAGIVLSGATFSNRAGATFNATGGGYSISGTSGVNAFLNAGTFNKSGSGTASFTGSGTSVVALANTGAINVSDGLLQLDGPFSNSGSVLLSGGTMTLGVGLDNTTGTIQLTGGALNLGGTITRAQLGSFSNSGGQVNLVGTLNNAAATLALDDTTGQLRLLAGSQIIGGTVSTAGAARLKIVGASTLDGLSLSGPVSVLQLTNLTVANGLTLGGAGGALILDAPGTAGTLLTLQGSQTIGGTGQITTAGMAGGTATLAVTPGSTLTLGPNILIHPAARDLLIGGSNATVINQGTMRVDVSGQLLAVSGSSVQNPGTFQVQDGATLAVSGNLINVSNGALSGGRWLVSGGGTLRLPVGQPITTNAAFVVIDGATSGIYQGGGMSLALSGLAQNAAAGDLSILGGKSLSTANDFVNAGKLTVGAGSALATPGLFSGSGTVAASGTLTTGKTTYDGFLTLSGGTHTVSSDFILGSTKDTARYDLSGQLSVGGFATVGSGPAGAGVFNQSDGSFSVGKQLYVSTAGTNTSTFNLGGGSVTAGDLFVAFFGGAKGFVNQTGGSVTLAGNTAVATTGLLTLGLSSLSNTAGVYNLSNGTLSDQGVQIGYAGADAFNHSGGTHTVSGAGLQLGMFAGGSGAYSMSNGATLAVSGGESIGTYGDGVFNQAGGNHTLAGTMFIGHFAGSSGTYNLGGGTLSADVVDLLRGTFNAGAGNLDVLNFIQEGGTVTGTLRNTHMFTFMGGAFSGRLVNSGTVILWTNFTAGDGLDNRAQFAVGTNRAVLLNGFGLTQDGAFSLSGGTLTASVERIGENADGAFTHAAGPNNVSGNLYVGFAAGRSGSYALQSGAANVSGTSYVGFNGSTGTFTHTGGTHTTGGLVIGAGGSYSLSGGALTAASTANGGAYAQSGGAASLGHVSGNGTIALSGGTLAAKTIRQSSLDVSGNGLVTLATNAGASVVRSLTVASGSGMTAAVDLSNNTLLIDYSGNSVIGNVRALVASGYGTAAAHWTGPGVRSSAAAADPSLGVGVAEAADVLHLSGTQTASFLGETVDATTVLVRVTKLGDTNLNGVVDFGDFQRFERGFNRPGGTWYTGDFNNDGLVDRNDFVALYHNYGQSLPGTPAAPVSAAELNALAVFAASVPEPAGPGALGVAGAAAMLRRARRRV
jgi:hypothetical protein